MRLKNKLIKTSTKTDKIGSLVLILFLFFGFSLFIKVVPQFFFIGAFERTLLWQMRFITWHWSMLFKETIDSCEQQESGYKSLTGPLPLRITLYLQRQVEKKMGLTSYLGMVNSSKNSPTPNHRYLRVVGILRRLLTHFPSFKVY